MQDQQSNDFLSYPSTELHQAYFWTCDNCGRDNFIRAVTRPMSEEERETMVENFRGKFGELADYLSDPVDYPLDVQCPSCKARYNTCGHTPGEEVDYMSDWWPGTN